jgi:hypothetical protein
MHTIYDWLSLIVFAGLVPLFLQRSSMDEPPDTVWHYLPPTVGCALSNYLGNEGYGVFAIIVLAAAIVYIFMILKPWPRKN